MSPVSLALSHMPRTFVGRGVMLAVLSALGFSAKAIFVKLAYRYQVDPVTLLTLRMLFALPFFMWMAWTAEKGGTLPQFDRRTWGKLFLLGIGGYYLSSIFDFIGLQYISSALERLVLYLYPTFVLIFSAIFLHKRISRQAMGALLLCYAGIGLAVAHDWQHASEGPDVLLGVAWVAACAVTYALYLVGAGELVKQIGPLQMAAWAGMISTLGVVVHFLVTQDLSQLVQPMPVYFYGLLMGIFSTVLPVLLMNQAMEMIGASRMAMVSTLGPVMTLLMGWVILGEVMSSQQLIGAALVLGGVMWVNHKPKTAT